jgi:cell division septum initiation protein DivIVA
MGEEAARLREEIERTRGDLTRDVDRLAEKTSPSRIVQRRVRSTRGRLAGVKERVMGTPDDRAWDRASGSAREGVSAAAEQAREGVSAAAEQAREVGGRAQEAAQEAVGGVREQTEGNPLAAGLVAFGVGWLVSSVLPPSEAETGAAQRAGQVAREHGGPVVEEAKQSARAVGEDLKEHAQDAASQVRDSAQDAAETVREHARSSVSG